MLQCEHKPIAASDPSDHPQATIRRGGVRFFETDLERQTNHNSAGADPNSRCRAS
jgi:hypothetical protein